MKEQRAVNFTNVEHFFVNGCITDVLTRAQYRVFMGEGKHMLVPLHLIKGAKERKKWKLNFIFFSADEDDDDDEAEEGNGQEKASSHFDVL